VTTFVNKAQTNTTENIFHFRVKRVLHKSRRTATRIFVLESDTILIPALLPSVTFTILRPRHHIYWFISRTQYKAISINVDIRLWPLSFDGYFEFRVQICGRLAGKDLLVLIFIHFKE